jgi:hypothetical protein
MRHASLAAAGGRFVLRIVGIACMLSIAVPAAAEEEAGGEAAEAEESRLSGSIQFDVTNAYFFRGILQERDGIIAQPAGDLYYSLYRSDDGPIRDFAIGGGVWASIHSKDTGEQHSPDSFYEVDWYPAISIEFPHAVSLTTYYYYYTSPNGAFDRADELDFELAWDDSEVFGRFALQPWINLAIETQNTAFGDEEGVGLQLGVEPTLYTFEHARYPVTLTVPLELGLGLNNYYEDESGGENTFGYFQFGLSASMPLAFLPESIGEWTLTVTGTGMSLSDTLADANRGRSLYPVFVAGLGVEF